MLITDELFAAKIRCEREMKSSTRRDGESRVHIGSHRDSTLLWKPSSKLLRKLRRTEDDFVAAVRDMPKKKVKTEQKKQKCETSSSW